MNGIQGLMQAPGQGQPPQAPGQAAPPGQGQPPMPGMQPGMGGAPTGISSDRIPELAKLNEQMLTQLFSLSMSGQIPNPSPISVLAAISEKQKQKQALAAVQGSMVQGQNAQNQQSGTIAQQIMGPLMAQQQQRQQVTRKAAHGGAMHSYADGGIVAFQSGTPPQGAQSSPVASIGPRSALEEYNEAKQQLVAATKSGDPRAVQFYLGKMQRLRERIEPRLLEEAERQTSKAQAPALVAQQLEGPPTSPESLMREIAGETRPLPQTPLPPDFVLPPAPTNRASAARPPAATPPAASPFAGLASLVPKPDPEMETAFKQAGAAAGPTPEQLRILEAKQNAEIEARTAAEAGRSKRAEDERARATRAYEEALSGQQGIFGPRGLLEIAAAIDPRRGQIMGSLARGAAGVMAREEKAKKEAKTEYDRAQQLYSQEINALDAMRVATRERDTAIAKGKVEDARAAEARRAQLAIDYNKIKDERFRAQQKFELDRAQAEATAAYQQRAAGAAEASARRPTETQEKIALFKSNPQMYKDMYGDKSATEAARLSTIFSNDPRLKKLAETLALDPTNPDVLAQYAAREKELTAKYAPEMLLSGVKPPTGGSSSARSAADAIIGAP